MAIEGFECAIKVKPIVDWVQEEDEKVCRPCLIKPLANYYLGTLQESKAEPKVGELVKNLEKAWKSADLLTIAKELDKIKSEVGDDLRKELVALDCFTQSYEEEVVENK